MNVYIDRSLRSLLKQYPSLSVEVFTIANGATGKGSRSIGNSGRRARIHCIEVGDSTLTKDELAAYTLDFARGVEAAMVQKPDVIHAHYWLSGLVALAYAPGVPLVQTMHTTAAAKNARAAADEKQEPQVRLEGEQALVDSGCTLVVNTELEAEQMRSFYSAQEAQLQVVTPGVERSIFKPCPGEEAENRGSHRRSKILFAGRPQPLKGPHLVVEALALLPADLEATFEVVGESGSTYEAELTARAQELGIQLTLTPSLPPRQLAQKFRTADIVVCPSSSETFGLVALEAQSCGAAVLASDVDGLRTAVLHEETGLLVAERTPVAWAQALEQLIRDPALREKLGTAGAQRTASMTWDDTAAQLMTIYRKLASI